MKHSDLKVWKFCPTSSCLSSQDPLFGEKLVLCVATSATILPKTMLWKCGFQNCKKCLLFDFQQLHTSYLFQCSPQTAPSPLYYTRWVFLRSTAQATHPGPVLTSPAFQVSAEIVNCGQNGWADPKYPADNSVMWVFKLFWFLSCLCKLRQMLQKWREIYFPYFVLYLLQFVFCWNTVARGRLDFTTSSAKTICFIILHQYWSVLPLLSIGKHILHGVSDTLNLQSGISLTRTKYVETKIKVHTFSCLYLLCESQEDGQWNWHWRSVVVSTHKKTIIYILNRNVRNISIHCFPSIEAEGVFEVLEIGI